MRILFADTQRGVAGGAQSYQRSLIPLLRARGHAVAHLHEVGVVSGQRTIDAPEDRVEGICVADLGAQAALAQARAFGPDCVFVHGLQHTSLERSLLELGPAFLYAHAYIGTCATGSKLHTLPALEACTRTLGLPCLPLNYLRGCGIRRPSQLLRSYDAQTTRRTFLPAYRKIFVASRHMHTEYARHGLSNVSVLPLFPTNVLPDPTPPTARPFTGRVLFAGRLTALKGARLLVPAMVRAQALLARPLTLVLAGEGPERKATRRTARAHGLTVDDLGWLSAAALSKVMREADVLAFPSLWPEPFGLVGIEAGGVGLPTVAFSTGGVSDWLLPGISGEFASPGPFTAGAFAEGLARAMRSPGHLTSLRVGGWSVARRHRAEEHVDHLLTILDDEV